MMTAGQHITKEEFPSQDGIVKLASAQRLKTSRPTAGGFSFFQSARPGRKPKEDDVPLNTGTFSQEEILAANRRHDHHYGWSSRFSRVYTNLARLPETTVGRLPWDQSTPQTHPV